ncbi:MAG: pyridoxal phosphate-dependent aminotransferase [Deltaproteobacteria bacterium]|nr:pyridoxal phosphate-dependent aminotransferase [Deltaproteobacteria bacterium]
MAIARNIQDSLARASWIRKMFEEGARLKEVHGPENVFDFSLGNPNLEPPEAFLDALAREAADRGPGRHAYMPNPGYPDVREAVAQRVSREQEVSVSGAEVVMTCGAAGALNVIFKAILDPGDEVLTPTPFFVEYGYYAANHGGKLVTVPTAEDFSLDLSAFEAAISPKTKAVLLNSPNNPTGQVYSTESLERLSALLARKSKELGRVIYLLSDEPYRGIAFDGIKVPSILAAYENSIVATSYSKELSIPGERIGFLAVNPAAEDHDLLLAALAMTNRILGFVNAPALLQRAVGAVPHAMVNPAPYQANRDILCKGLAEAGYRFTTPKGAFYLFPKSPIPDDVAFVAELQKERILAVPGSGFGGPGHFRLAFCVDSATIENALPGFARAIKNVS